MKPLKMYIPVSVVKQVPLKRVGFHRHPTYERKVRTTLVNVMSCLQLMKQLPASRDIAEHLNVQRMGTNAGLPYTSIKVGVTPALYAMLCDEVTRVSHVRYHLPVIDVIFELGQPPVIQVTPNHTPRRRRTIPPINEQ